MSTYTDIHTRIRENLAVDADPASRTTVQKVKFKNEENEYWGTFVGNVQAEALAIGSNMLSGLNLVKTNLVSSYVTLDDGQRVPLADIAEACEASTGRLVRVIEGLAGKVETLSAEHAVMQAQIAKLSNDLNASYRELYNVIEEKHRKD